MMWALTFQEIAIIWNKLRLLGVVSGFYHGQSPPLGKYGKYFLEFSPSIVDKQIQDI